MTSRNGFINRYNKKREELVPIINKQHEIMKRILTFLLLAFALKANAQLLTFSSELGYFSNDENIATIQQVWEGYVNAVAKGSDTTPFWVQDSHDVLVGAHKDGLLNTYNIRKLTDKIYEINTIAYYPDEAIKGGLINSIYKVCAMQTHEGWRLMNYFDATKSRYVSHRIGNVDFYIGLGVMADRKKMKESARFAESFIGSYQLDHKIPITYVVADSIDECSAMIGLSYTPMRSHKPFAGRTIHNLILSTRLNHIHEIVHAIMLPHYPDAPLFLHEGIATYYGGMAEQTYKDIKSIAKKYIILNDNDLSTQESLNAPLGNEVQLSNVVAAAIIEYTLQQGGESKVLPLFEATTYDEVFTLLGIDKEQQSHFIRTLFK